MTIPSRAQPVLPTPCTKLYTLRSVQQSWGERFFSFASGMMLLFLGMGEDPDSPVAAFCSLELEAGMVKNVIYLICLFFILNPKRAAEGAFTFGCWLVITFMRKPGNWRLASPSPAVVARLLTCAWTLSWDPGSSLSLELVSSGCRFPLRGGMSLTPGRMKYTTFWVRVTLTAAF